MANIWGNSGNSGRLYFGDSKITAGGDCSHEIKRHLLVLEKTLESPLDCKEIQPVHTKGDQSCSLEVVMLKLKLQYFGHLISRADSFEKSLMLGKIEGRRRRG